MIVYPVKSVRIIEPGMDIVEVLFRSLAEKGLRLKNGDIIAITSKVVSYMQRRIARLDEIEPSQQALNLASKYGIEPAICQLIIENADEIVGGVPGYILTVKDGVVMGNAGIDRSNSPPGYVILPVRNPMKTAAELRRRISRKSSKRVSVLIVDSRVEPLRRGTIGVAVGVSGFIPVVDERGKPDLYGKPLRVTRRAVADELASTAELYMCERDEKVPFVLFRNAPVEYTDVEYRISDLSIDRKSCLFFGSVGM